MFGTMDGVALRALNLHFHPNKLGGLFLFLFVQGSKLVSELKAAAVCNSPYWLWVITAALFLFACLTVTAITVMLLGKRSVCISNIKWFLMQASPRK